MRLCECGCGEPAPIAKKTERKWGSVKGQPKRFIAGHNLKNHGKNGPNHPSWKGGKIHFQGYVLILQPNHPRANPAGYVFEHILIAEKAIGKPLLPQAVVHHFNEKKNHNRNDNLVICNDESYHQLLHRRKRALIACGHANWRKCCYCHQYDKPENLYIPKKGYSSPYHQECNNRYRRIKYRRMRQSGG
ncbi:MAG: hypothetical protein RBR16_13470 [Syntrophus sp. (in: bacteria)]|nr:hypothetical protein [Syntrophus sp. (in: bacteria)]